MTGTTFKLIVLASLYNVAAFGQDAPTQDVPIEEIQTQDIPPTEGVIGEDPIHQELRALKDAVMDAFNKRDMERLATYL